MLPDVCTHAISRLIAIFKTTRCLFCAILAVINFFINDFHEQYYILQVTVEIVSPNSESCYCYVCC